ncbi:MAG: hypothetical protein Q8O30_06355 [Candidatus Omnitrophota bacterium]|nr:hypothetical protein [Candidatus Omnitrophota bacterium]
MKKLIYIFIVATLVCGCGSNSKERGRKEYAEYITVDMKKSSFTYTHSLFFDYLLQICLRNKGAKPVKGVTLRINYYDTNHRPLSSEEVLNTTFNEDMGGQILPPNGELTVTVNKHLNPPKEKYIYSYTVTEVEFE